MSKKIEIISTTPWVSLRRIHYPEYDVQGYDYLHEDRCNGHIVSILPYRYSDIVLDDRFIPTSIGIQYLLRKEVTPCWGEQQFLSSITGGVEDKTTRQSAINELSEEAGYEVNIEDIIYLDKCFGTKSADTVYYLFTVNLSDKEKTLGGDGDGSELEKKAECVWSNSIDGAVDPLVYVLYYHIKNKIFREGKK